MKSDKTLSEILEAWGITYSHKQLYGEDFTKIPKQAILAAVEGIIGEDTHKYCDATNHPNPSCDAEIAQEKLRAELRKKFREWCA